MMLLLVGSHITLSSLHHARALCSVTRSKNVEVTCLSKRQREDDMGMGKGKMTVQEAGRKGGAKGGPRVRELIEEGKAYEKE